MHAITQTLIREKFRSTEALARQLIAADPALEWPDPRSVAAKIGMLCKGNAVWWKSRPGQARVLADALGFDVADLGLHAQDGPGLFHFTDFPELPPLDPASEPFCMLAAPLGMDDNRDQLDLWFDQTPRQLQRQPSACTWLKVAPGSGRKVLLAEFAAQARFEVVEVNQLADAALALRKRGPVVVAISEAGGESDIFALARRPEGAATLVIASFAAPMIDAAGLLTMFSWESATASDIDRRARELTTSGGVREVIHAAEWRLEPDWRSRLLGWVEQRLDRHRIDTLFSAEGLARWLLQFDPHGEWIRTPADLMALCRVSHRLPETQLPKAGDDAASGKLLKAIVALRPGQDRELSRLAIARWDAIDQPWRTALPYAQWQAWCPAGSAVDTIDELLAVADGARREERRALARRLAGKLAGASALEGAGLLAQDAHGRMDLQPRLLADIAVRDYLMRAIKEGTLAAWAPGCFDRERRATLDAALDALGGDELALAWSRLEADDQPGADALALAATEALFCAAGRRILRGEILAPTLASLAERMLALLPMDDVEWALPAAWTRPQESALERCDWLACCWAWSLQPAPARPGLAERVGWLFPGWAGSAAAVPSWIDFLVSELGDAVADALPWQRLLEAAERLVARRDCPVEEAPMPMHHALLAGAAHGRWRADPQWWRFVIRHPSVEARLLQALGPVDAALAARLWRSWFAYEVQYGQVPEGYRALWAPMRQRILGALAPDDLLAQVADGEWRYLLAMVGSLPPALRRAMLERMPLAALADDDDNLARRLFAQCEAGAAHLLARWLATGSAIYAAERMWELDAGAALAWVRAHAATLPEKAALMVRVSRPRDAAPVARLLLAVEGGLDDEERVEWARSRLPQAGPDAGLLLSVAELAGAGISACLRR